MRAHHGEQQELAAIEIGRVYDNVVEMLPGDGLMIGDDDISRGKAVLAVALHAVGDDDTEVGHEMRHSADVLTDQFARRVDERRAEIAHLVDHHIVGGALEIDRHLIGDGRQCIADHFERDRIELRHYASPTVMINSPDVATSQMSFSNKTVVVPCS